MLASSQHQPPLQAMRVGELVREARLAHPRLADDRRRVDLEVRLEQVS